MEGETQATNMKYCTVHTPQTHKLALGKFSRKAGGSKAALQQDCKASLK